MLVAGFIIMGTLAAMGALSLLWLLAGWLLPAGQGCVLVCFEMPDEGVLSRYRWLRGAGLLCCPLLAVEAGQPLRAEDIEYCSGEELLSRVEWERKRTNGTGNGDSPGCGQCRGVSEL